MKKFLLHILFFLSCASILVLSVRGLPGNPNVRELNTLAWKDHGPLELSPERGRFALLYSIVEDHSFAFSPDLARFVTPDVGYVHGKYASLFAPAVSFVAIPGYILGKYFNASQLGAFLMISLFALFNLYLIRAIAIHLGAHPLASTISGIAFLFASPAFAYAVTLYQHHISTFLILSSIFLLLRYNNVFSLMAIWILFAFSLSVDYPNLFLMLPVALFALLKTFVFTKELGSFVIQIPFIRIFSVIAMIVPLLFFLWFNKMSYDNPFQLAGTIERVIEVKSDGSPLFESEIIAKRLKEMNIPAPQDQGSALNFFKPRNMINGFYIHIFSPDRGLLMYTPVMVFGLIGAFFALRSQRLSKYVGLLMGVLGFDILLYSMWGDPYGGWAFGSRYLIPAYAILSILMAIALTRLAKYNLFLLLFFAIFTYSMSVNTLGALTSSRNPPQIEAQALERQTNVKEEYTYMRNINMLNANLSKSYVYQRYASTYISAWDYYLYLTLFIVSVMSILIFASKITLARRTYDDTI